MSRAAGVLLPLLAMLLATACQMTPTKVGETQHRQFETLIIKSARPIELTDQTVVLDARSAFEYGLNRVQDSQHFTWESLAQTSVGGELLHDPRQAGLRLSLIGITPDTPVVVVGDGRDAGAGRLAWALLYYGVKDVQLVGFEMLRKSWTQAASPPAKNVRPWTPDPREDLTVDKGEFQRLQSASKIRADSHVWILDVRDGSEVSAHSAAQTGVVRLSWKEFLNDQGRPNARIDQKLAGLGIHSLDQVILVSENGVQSAAAAYALLAAGFVHVQNFVDGFRSLQSKP